jgi:hypothetical protein
MLGMGCHVWWETAILAAMRSTGLAPLTTLVLIC